jgi:hypothetical protein
MAAPLQPAIQNFFNTLCCSTPPSGVPPTINYTKTTFSFSEGNAVNECPNTLSGDHTITLSISPSLPDGLTFNTSTGCITGTPTEPRLVESYTVTATNAFGTATDSFNLVVSALGEITIKGGGIASKANGTAYLDKFSTTYTNVSYDVKNDILYWTEPANTDYTISVGSFMTGTSGGGDVSDTAIFNDPNHRITIFGASVFQFNTQDNDLSYVTSFGDDAFVGSTGNNTLGDVTFGINAFQNSTGDNTFGDCTFGVAPFLNSTGNNTFGDCTFGDGAFQQSTGINNFGNILLSNSNDFFALQYNGTININGNIGPDEDINYSNAFQAANDLILNVKTSKQTSNAGGIEGDIQNAINNGATVNFVL